MKTKEPIKCPTCGGDCRIEWSGLDLVENSGDETLATKHYIPIVDQQNKEKDAEIQRLKERNKYLEEHSNERFEQANELNDQDQEIQRLTNSYNTCAENFAALQVRFGEEAAKVTRLTKELQEAKTSDGRGWKAVERLTKKVEELKKQVNGWAHTAGTYQNEITRLRELLSKTMPHVQTCEGSDSKLLTEIDNELNPKP